MSTSTIAPQSISAQAKAAQEDARKIDGKFGAQVFGEAEAILTENGYYDEYTAENGYPEIRPLQSAFINESQLTQESAWEYVKMFPNATADEFEDALFWEYETESEYRNDTNNQNSELMQRRENLIEVNLVSGGVAVFNRSKVAA